jgi:hypothetical protein
MKSEPRPTEALDDPVAEADTEAEIEAPTGYRRPPRHSQFRKGRSGNPGGRPRRTADLATLLAAALDKPAMIVEGGKRRRVTKREQILSQLVECSAQANLRAMKLLVDLMQKIAPRAPLPEPPPLDDVDEKVIATVLMRLGMAE